MVDVVCDLLKKKGNRNLYPPYEPQGLQVYALSGSICIYYVFGYCVGLQGVLIPILKDKQSEIPLSDEQISWIPSSLVLVQIPALVVGGVASDTFGRKIVVVLGTIPGLICCLMTYYAQDFTMLLIANAIAGWTSAGLLAGPVIVSEAVSPKYRGAMLAIKNSFWGIGLSTTHLMRSRCYWRHIALYGLIPSMLGLILTSTMPESPAWFAKEGRYKEARKAFEWYRGKNEEKELAELIRSQEVQKTIKKSMNNSKQLIKFISDKTFLKVFFVCIVIFVYIEATSKRLFAVYSPAFVQSIMSSSDNYTSYALAFDIIDIVFNLVAGLVMDRFGRRKFLFCFGIPSIFLGFIFCLVNYLCHHEIISLSYAWLSMTFYILYFVPITIGVMPILTVIYGEIVPLSFRGVNLALSCLFYSGICFVMIKYTLTLLDHIAIHGLYLALMIISTLCMVVIYYMVPETNLRTLVDVENEMRGAKGDEFDVEMKEFMIEGKHKECGDGKCS